MSQNVHFRRIVVRTDLFLIKRVSGTKKNQWPSGPTCANLPDSFSLDERLWTQIPQRLVHSLLPQLPLGHRHQGMLLLLLLPWETLPPLLLQSVDDALAGVDGVVDEMGSGIAAFSRVQSRAERQRLRTMTTTEV